MTLSKQKSHLLKNSHIELRFNNNL